MKFSLKEDGKRLLIIVLASLIMALNIRSFVRTAGLYPGGATGLTILCQQIALRFFGIQVSYSLVNILLNAVPIYIGFRYIGKKFTLYSCVMILLTGFFTDLVRPIYITYDTLLLSIFGGMINGFAISLCLSQDATSGGTDFISIFFSQKTGRDSWNLILGINAMIILAAGLLFGWDKALYSLIFQYASTQVLHMRHKRYQQETLFIVTNKAQEVCDAISEVSHHGATIMEGQGSYDKTERSVVYSVVSSAESGKVIRVIKEVDEKAFINLVKTEQVSGRFYQRPTD